MISKMVAATPPMGWNSWDCYGASVTEEEVRGNASYMAEHLKGFGWEYIVVDIQWYEPGAYTSSYRPFVELDMDGYSRLIPSVGRFPSSAEGKGFKPLADYVHSLGLKFGIHILRGIPRQAVHRNTPILGTSYTAREIASTNSICNWNTDMYGVNTAHPGAQAYYDSLLELYASWGVDFIKVDDIARSFIGDKLYFAEEIELIHHAIEKCGRPIVLSLSPGPTPLEAAEHVQKHANMWRMTNDYWDRWEDLVYEFGKCNEWSKYVGPAHWPDADMLPIGHIGIRSCEHGFGDRYTRFTKEEQLTMMTLWCIFRSPLMIGCELRDMDEWTLSLLTNKGVLRVLNHSHLAHQVSRSEEEILWTAQDEDGSWYLAVFNISKQPRTTKISLHTIGLEGSYKAKDLWSHETLGEVEEYITLEVGTHGARLIHFEQLKTLVE